MSEGETVVCSDDESFGETELLYQLQDGRIEGGSEGNSIPDSPDLPNRPHLHGRHTIGASFIYRRSNALQFNNGHTSRGRKLGATSGPSLI